MCTWKRVERLPRTLELLAAQTEIPDLYVWNNNEAAADRVDEIVRGQTEIATSVIHSPANAGGFGRFLAARELAKRSPLVVFVDDDQEFDPDLIATFRAEHEPRTITAAWAANFVSGEDYWKRAEAAPGEPVTYCGTGGLVADASLFQDPGLYRCPAEYWLIEDLWLSYYAGHVKHWRLRKSAATVRTVSDGRDQYEYLRRGKNKFLRQLVAAGWELRPPERS